MRCALSPRSSLASITACQTAQTLTVPARAGTATTPISEAAPLGLEPVGALAGFDSAGTSAEPVGALAGFDSAAIALTGPPAPAAMAAGCAQRMCRATAERSIPNPTSAVTGPIYKKTPCF